MPPMSLESKTSLNPLELVERIMQIRFLPPSSLNVAVCMGRTESSWSYKMASYSLADKRPCRAMIVPNDSSPYQKILCGDGLSDLMTFSVG